jgi:hypothetical protein
MSTDDVMAFLFLYGIPGVGALGVLQTGICAVVYFVARRRKPALAKDMLNEIGTIAPFSFGLLISGAVIWFAILSTQ